MRKRGPLKRVEEEVEEKGKEGFLRGREEEKRVADDMVVRISLGIISSQRFRHLGNERENLYKLKSFHRRGVYAVLPLLLYIDFMIGVVTKNPYSIISFQI